MHRVRDQADRGAEDEAAKREARQAEDVIRQLAREERDQPRQHDDFPVVTRHLGIDQAHLVVRHDVGSRALAEQIARDQERQRGAERRAGDDVDRALDDAEDETGAGRQQHPWQYENHNRGHDQHEQHGGPGALRVDPLEHPDELFVDAEIEQHGDDRGDHGDARGERAERRLDRIWQQAGGHGRYRVVIPRRQSNPRRGAILGSSHRARSFDIRRRSLACQTVVAVFSRKGAGNAKTAKRCRPGDGA